MDLYSTKQERYIRYGDPGCVRMVFIVGDLVQLVDVLIPQIPNLCSPESQQIVSKYIYDRQFAVDV